MGTHCGLQPELRALQRGFHLLGSRRRAYTEEANNFIDEVEDLGKPIFILSGGEPLNRPDVF